MAKKTRIYFAYFKTGEGKYIMADDIYKAHKIVASHPLTKDKFLTQLALHSEEEFLQEVDPDEDTPD